MRQFQDYCRAKNIHLGQDYFDILCLVAAKLRDHLRAQVVPESKTGGCMLVGISGAQGSGKSTFAALLAQTLEVGFDLSTLVLSLDDFYLSRAQRLTLAASVHPLLKTRGVPGTHDIELLRDVIQAVVDTRGTDIPLFNKMEDDRQGSRYFAPQPVRIIILEGWCWGATPCAPQLLEPPINALEAEADPSGIWRIYVNDQLGRYQSVFRTDYSIFLKVPDMQSVLQWRWQQEQQGSGSQAMSQPAISRFIMAYERITLRMLQDMPAQVDLTLALDRAHKIALLPTR